MKLKDFCSLTALLTLSSVAVFQLPVKADTPCSAPEIAWEQFSFSILSPNSSQLVKGSGPEVFLIQNGVRRWITDSKTFDSCGFNYSEVKEVLDSELKKYPLGTPISNNGTLLKGSGSEVYIILGGTRRLIPARVFVNYQLQSQKVYRVSDRNLFSIPEGVAFR